MFLHAFIRIIFICIEHHTLLQGMLVFHPEPCIPIPFLNSSHEPVPTQWRQHTMVDQELTVIQSGRQQLAYLNDSHHLSTRNRNTLHYPLYIFLQILVQRLEYFCSWISKMGSTMNSYTRGTYFYNPTIIQDIRTCVLKYRKVLFCLLRISRVNFTRKYVLWTGQYHRCSEYRESGF